MVQRTSLWLLILPRPREAKAVPHHPAHEGLRSHPRPRHDRQRGWTIRAKTTAEEGVADAKRPRTEQEAQNSSSSLVEPKAISEVAEVPFDDRHAMSLSTAQTKSSWSFRKFKWEFLSCSRHVTERAEDERRSSDDGRDWRNAGS